MTKINKSFLAIGLLLAVTVTIFSTKVNAEPGQRSDKHHHKPKGTSFESFELVDYLTATAKYPSGNETDIDLAAVLNGLTVSTNSSASQQGCSKRREKCNDLDNGIPSCCSGLRCDLGICRMAVYKIEPEPCIHIGSDNRKGKKRGKGRQHCHGPNHNQRSNH